ncbi:MAG: hypothetical protein C0601_02410 [Candidatus Muiribacterium halophilum]|uniref:Uncharacterized protein n=1 Tax=Muiribacterium halophilum TaxID=2053465 RepID=A0A2N5ZKP8_MUIH1|nr:MAG: hypothetical protein C0601_02410 [Candidatus Muirbacterium halophilum]
MEAFCKICGEFIPEIDEGSEFVCTRDICKKLYKINFVDNKKKTTTKVDLKPLRPWTSGCIDNLWKNMLRGWPSEKTAKETNRDVEDVRRMTEVLRKEGFEKIYYQKIAEEKSIKGKSINIDWLLKNGLVK